MTDDLRAAADRRRADDYTRHPSSYDEYWMSEQKFDDMKVLADAYLADHPADDGEGADVDWLISVGFVLDAWAVRRGLLLWSLARTGWFIGSQELTPPSPVTRGWVRRLAFALGIPLTEKPQ